ncbi:hypothetical protein Patl1_29911 [Pistacia atlantica]|uniref:Uncharacterized protein n=1 Tax=Pistacia atlantica TaxID=434234 RepID=A0ACC1ABG4_9ROSI|nr:hypothetical protein Patl1_29911 [Pistacia atlantica]
MRSFLWLGNELVNGKAKVAWKDLCVPKANRDLGIRPLKGWNYSLMISHLWSVVVNKDSLWLKWINTFRLKGRSFWM